MTNDFRNSFQIDYKNRELKIITSVSLCALCDEYKKHTYEINNYSNRAGRFVYASCIRPGTSRYDTTLNRTVVVENQYNPEVMDAFKINVLPEVEEPTVPKQHIDYATSLHPFSAWEFTPMQAMTSDEKQQKAPGGYARVAYFMG